MTAEAPAPAPQDRDTPGQRRRFARVVLLLFCVLVLAQAPLLWMLTTLTGLGAGWVVGWFLLLNAQIGVRVWWVPRPTPPPAWFERYVIWFFFGWSILSLAAVPVVMLSPWLPEVFTWAGLGLALVFTLYAVGIPWRRVRITHLDLPMVDLPPALEGLRVVQLSDLHLGPLVPEGYARRVIRVAMALKPDVVAITGDVIAAGPAFLPALERTLAGLKPRLGTFAVMGNHDYFSGANKALRAVYGRLRFRVLDNAHHVLRRGGASLVIAGVDDTWRGHADIQKALTGAPELPVLLLAHDPDLFPAAAAQGVAIQLSGHTHGGQLAIPFLGRRGALLSWFGQDFVQGAYVLGQSVLYVSGGLGTTAAPVRIGMPAELPCFRLVRGVAPEAHGG